MNKIIILFFVFCVGYLFPQDFQVVAFNTSNGLNTNIINDAAVDELGNLWLGTNLGLKKFDGHNVVNYCVPNRNQSSILKVVYHQNHLFLLYTDRRLLELDLKTNTAKALSPNMILDFYVHGKKLFLLNNKFEIEKREGNKKVYYRLKHTDKPPLDYSKNYSITYYNNEIYLALANKGVKKIENNKIIPITDQKIGFRSQFKITGNHLYLCNVPLRIYKDNRVENINFDPKNIFVYSDFAVQGKAYYYIKNDKSLEMRMGEKTISILPEQENVELKKIIFSGKSIYVTSNKGLFRIIPTQKVSRSFDLGHKMLVKRKILEDGERILFFGYPGIVSKGKNNEIKTLQRESGQYDALKVNDEYYLLNENRGMAVTDRDFKNIRRIGKDKASNFNSLFYDPQEDLIYYGNNLYLFFFKPKEKIIFKIPHPFPGYTIKALVKDQVRKRLIVGTENGLFAFEKENGRMKKLLNNRLIGALLLDSKNNHLWVGYDYGILLYSLADFTLIKSLPLSFLKNPRVASLLQDDLGRIWAGTFSGLAAYDPLNDNLLEIKNPHLINDEYNYKAACKLQNGNLIFGGLNGYDEINPKAFDFSSQAAYGRISGYHLITPTKKIYHSFYGNEILETKNTKEYLRIYFTAPQNTEQLRNSFQYKLNNTQWIDLNEQYIDLVGLSKGVYTLEIRGVDDLGKKISFKPLFIKVSEAFYKTDAFLIILILALSLLLIISLNMGVKRLKMKNDIYEKISMDLHDEVGTLLSKTSLLMEQKNALEHEQERIKENIKKANYGLRAYINSINSKDQQLIYLYYDCIETMEGFLNVRKIPFSYSFSGKNTITLSQKLYKDLKLCCYEIFNNTLKYSATDFVSIKFEEKNRLLTISVVEENNSFQMEEKKMGNGIMNIKKRITRNMGEVKFINDPEKNTYTILFKIKL